MERWRRAHVKHPLVGLSSANYFTDSKTTLNSIRYKNRRTLYNFFFSLQQSGGGYVTDEELELCQTIEDRNQSEEKERRATSGSRTAAVAGDGCDSSGAVAVQPEDIQSPSREVLIADNDSRR